MDQRVTKQFVNSQPPGTAVFNESLLRPCTVEALTNVTNDPSELMAKDMKRRAACDLKDIFAPLSDFAASVQSRFDKNPNTNVGTKRKTRVDHVGTSSRANDVAADPRSRSAGRSSVVKVNMIKVPGFRNPDVHELTKGLLPEKPVTPPPKPKPTKKKKRRLVDTSIKDGIFTEGRQRPNGPVKTFIVFKATARRSQLRAKGAKSKKQRRSGEEDLLSARKEIKTRLEEAIRKGSADQLRTKSSMLLRMQPKETKTWIEDKQPGGGSRLKGRWSKLRRRFNTKSVSSGIGRSAVRVGSRQRAPVYERSGFETSLKSRIINVLRWKKASGGPRHE